MFFSGITKNLNWEILTENLVTFNRWDGAKNEKFQYHGHSQKDMIGGEGHEKPGLGKKEGRGGGGRLIPQCTLCS